MSLKQKVEKLERESRTTAGRNNLMVEMVMPWPGEAPRTIMVPRGTMEAIVKIYGPKSPADPPGEPTHNDAPKQPAARRI